MDSTDLGQCPHIHEIKTKATANKVSFVWMIQHIFCSHIFLSLFFLIQNEEYDSSGVPTLMSLLFCCRFLSSLIDCGS